MLSSITVVLGLQVGLLGRQVKLVGPRVQYIWVPRPPIIPTSPTYPYRASFKTKSFRFQLLSSFYTGNRICDSRKERTATDVKSITKLAKCITQKLLVYLPRLI